MLSPPLSTQAEPKHGMLAGLDTLNAVRLGCAQIAAALEAIALLPAGYRDNPHAQAEILQAYVRDARLGDVAVTAATLHARLTALAKWTAAHDPERQSDPEAVMEAAAQAPLVETGHGIGFEAAAFQEMVLFIEALPW